MIDEECSDKSRAAIFCAAGDVVETISTNLYLVLDHQIMFVNRHAQEDDDIRA